MRALWLAMIIVISLMVGAAGGVLTWMSTHDTIAGIFAGAGSFGGSVLLLLAMAAFLSPAINRL